MKKLLAILWAIILIVTSITNVIACGLLWRLSICGCCRTKTTTVPNTRTDISKKIKRAIDLGQLDANTKVDFLAKLQTALTKIPNLNTITTSDYNVYKAGTTIEIQDSDIIVGNYLNIKIVTKESKFQGNADNITTNYSQKDTRTDISKKIKRDVTKEQEKLKKMASFSETKEFKKRDWKKVIPPIAAEQHLVEKFNNEAKNKKWSKTTLMNEILKERYEKVKLEDEND